MSQIKKKILYWSPFIVKIATPLAVVNSANSINKYSKDYTTSILNFFGEFNYFKSSIENQKDTYINFYKMNILKYLPKHGKIQSRFSFFIISPFAPNLPSIRLILQSAPMVQTNCVIPSSK